MGNKNLMIIRRFLGTLLSLVMVISMIPGISVSAADNSAKLAELINIPNADDIRGNITLPEEIDGFVITWSEVTKTNLVTLASEANAGYDDTPAGVVTRPGKDTQVILRAAATDENGVTTTMDFALTIKAKAAEKSDEDYIGYLMAYFAGDGLTTEQVFLAVSEDGLNWSGLNDGKAVLVSTLGDKGVRDPYIARSPEGDKFYLIATDLCIAGRNWNWGGVQTDGSQSIMVWESTDLVNWSEQRMVEITASIDAGCTWAPEFYYDEITGEYIVFWASKVSADNYGQQRIYYSKTRDFHTFTEPEILISKSARNGSVIDTTYIKDGDAYYRWSKNEGQSTIFLEKGDSMLGDFEQISADIGFPGVEGPSVFKFNSRDTDGADKWCLLLDNYGGIRYYPTIMTDLGDVSTYTSPDSFVMPVPRACHGSVVNLTAEEYYRVSGITVDVESITLSPGTLKLKEGQTGTITPLFYPTYATDQTLTWSTDNSAVATVSNGIVTAAGVGNTKITATTGNGKTASCNVSVESAVNDPTNLKLEKADTNSIKVSWTKASDMDGYEVWYSTAANGTYSNAGSTSENSYTHKGLTIGSAYYYKVRAYKNVNGSKSYSAYTSTASLTLPVPTPTNIKTANAGAVAVTVSWGKVSDASGYIIYRAESKSGIYKQVGKAGSTKSTYTDTGLKNKKTYYYKVRAYKTVNSAEVYSDYTNAVQRKTQLLKPAGVKAVKKSAASIKVSWKKASGVTNYKIYRATSKNGKYRPVKTVSGKKSSYTDKKLAKGKTYFYRVEAIQKVGKKNYKSALSDKKSARLK